MTSLKKNATANLVGTGAVALIYFLVLPVYLKLLGAEAFGIVGLFLSLSAMFAFFDFGLGTNLNRLLAQLTDVENAERERRTALRTHELPVVTMCLALGILLLHFLPLLVDHWLRIGQLEPEKTKTAFHWMAWALALQMVLNLYTNALWGLQRQVMLNIVNAVMVAVRLLGAIILMIHYSSDLIHFFIWQVCTLVLHAIVLSRATWYCLPGANVPKFDITILGRSKQFIVEVASATLLASLLMHIDKIILSNLMPVHEYGYYMIAWSLASILGRFATPLYAAWVPRLTQHVANNDAGQLKSTYYKGLKLLSVTIVPSALILALFSEFALFAYTDNSDLAKASDIALILLSIGWACNGLMLMPHAVAMAHGWTRLSLIQNICACIVICPLVYLAVIEWGLNGAGIGWLLVNVSLLAVSLPMIQRKYLCTPMR